MNERGNHSEDTARKIDFEVKGILTDAHKRPAGCCASAAHPRPAVARLLEREVIEGDELRALLGPVPPKDSDATVPGTST